jgi:hypothetical protein
MRSKYVYKYAGSGLGIESRNGLPEKKENIYKNKLGK